MIEINNKTRSNININLVKKVSEQFLNYYKIKNKDLSVAFIGDTAMHRLNKQYRKKDSVTDILSFEGDNDKNDLGEIVIDYMQIKRQAIKYSSSAEEELIFILVHGLLHLLEYDDKTEDGRQTMEKLGKDFIKKFNYDKI